MRARCARRSVSPMRTSDGAEKHRSRVQKLWKCPGLAVKERPSHVSAMQERMIVAAQSGAACVAAHATPDTNPRAFGVLHECGWVQPEVDRHRAPRSVTGSAGHRPPEVVDD